MTFPTRTLDALCDSLWMRCRALGSEPITYMGIMMSNSMGISRGLFIVRSTDCLRDGIDQVMCSTKIGSCSLQEEQML